MDYSSHVGGQRAAYRKQGDVHVNLYVPLGIELNAFHLKVNVGGIHQSSFLNVGDKLTCATMDYSSHVRGQRGAYRKQGDVHLNLYVRLGIELNAFHLTVSSLLNVGRYSNHPS